MGLGVERNWAVCELIYVLNYEILYYTILYYTILYYTILYYTILYYTIVYHIIQRLKSSMRIARSRLGIGSLYGQNRA